MSSGDSSRPVALVADDDEVTRLLLGEAAAQAGLAVVSVSNGRDALSIGLKTEFAVALLDVDMPELSGHDVCRALRASTHARTLPIIMITGHDDAASVQRAFDAGATDFIPKPLNLPLMPRRLEYILRNAGVLRTLETREAEYRTLIQSIPDTVYLVAADGRVRRVWNDPQDPASDGAGRHDRPLSQVLPPAIGARAVRSASLTARDGQPRLDEYTTVVDSGEQQAYEIRYFRCGTGEVMALRQEVTARKLAEQRVHQLAFYDPTTALPNRQSFYQLLGAELATLAERNEHERQLAVTVLQLSGLDRINETFGHSIGDEVMRTVAGELARCVEPLRAEAAHAVIARLEGNQFVLLIRGREAAGLSQRTAQVFSAVLGNAVRCRQHEFFLQVSVGIALSPDHGVDAEILVKNASTAMFENVSRGSFTHTIYADEMSARAQMKILLDSELRRAVGQNGLQLAYQPQFDVASGAPLGAEALLRWNHPSLGAISPLQLITLAEESGLILEISAWVLRSVCRQIGVWRRLGLDVSIAVNLSGKDFVHGDPAALVARELAAAGIPAANLELEITESVLVTDFARVTSGLAALRDLGCRVALDDFGTGYSSLGYLQRLPLDRLKVDRSFVTGVHQNPADGAIFEAIIALARSVGLKVTAEGVEEPDQLDWLRRHGCDEAQGYLLARPMSAADLELLFAAAGTARADIKAASG
jgi:diguanylate cyclase (GGDEF)-like protein